jgi:hypothetical protein
MPEWYPLLRAARYLGVPPWELAKRPMGWTQMALTAEKAEGIGAQIARDLAKQEADMNS